LRLPPPLAEKARSVAFEFAMAGWEYCVVLRNGTIWGVSTGTGFDFTSLPPGALPEDVVDVVPNEGGERHSVEPSWWCLARMGK
jgi:hypothetical protein